MLFESCVNGENSFFVSCVSYNEDVGETVILVEAINKLSSFEGSFG